MRVRRAALVVVAVALVAGWSGSVTAPVTTSGGATAPNASASNAATASPETAASETETTELRATTAESRTTTASDDLPPGLNESGVEDPEALVDAHRAALDDTGFAFRFRANVTVGSASQLTVQHGAVEEGLAPLLVNSTSERDLGDGPDAVATELWADKNTTVVRYDRGDDETSVQRYNRSADGFSVPDETWGHLPRADIDSQVTNAWLIELALTAGEYDLDGIERRDGREVAVLRATEAVAAANVTEVDSTVVVDREGRVRELSLTATYEGDPATRASYEFELTELGDVEVERPVWVDAAIPPGTPTPRSETDADSTTASNATSASDDR
ncbi:hypothetical protein [Halorussus amylolyticus]|uniref:hypothetical protein n=1 Tax=Halorussus amylolyticus TaxID=1126242 RepID=UPI0010537294|nr:hypothetical protein [Halorussus amylolyticus]